MHYSRHGGEPWRGKFKFKKKISRAKQLRDAAKSIADFRKALSVILAAELDLDADRTADILGQAAVQSFGTGTIFAIKTTRRHDHGAAAVTAA